MSNPSSSKPSEAAPRTEPVPEQGLYSLQNFQLLHCRLKIELELRPVFPKKLRIMNLIMNNTLLRGWKSNRITISEFVDGTGLSLGNVHAELKQLRQLRMIEKLADDHWCVQPLTDLWGIKRNKVSDEKMRAVYETLRNPRKQEWLAFDAPGFKQALSEIASVAIDGRTLREGQWDVALELANILPRHGEGYKAPAGRLRLEEDVSPMDGDHRDSAGEKHPPVNGGDNKGGGTGASPVPPSLQSDHDPAYVAMGRKLVAGMRAAVVDPKHVPESGTPERNTTTESYPNRVRKAPQKPSDVPDSGTSGGQKARSVPESGTKPATKGPKTVPESGTRLEIDGQAYPSRVQPGKANKDAGSVDVDRANVPESGTSPFKEHLKGSLLNASALSNESLKGDERDFDVWKKTVTADPHLVEQTRAAVGEGWKSWGGYWTNWIKVDPDFVCRLLGELRSTQHREAVDNPGGLMREWVMEWRGVSRAADWWLQKNARKAQKASPKANNCSDSKP